MIKVPLYFLFQFIIDYLAVVKLFQQAKKAFKIIAIIKILL